MPRKLSEKQAGVLDAMFRLEASGALSLEARTIAIGTGQSSDGAAYTLRSLVRRGLVEVVQNDGQRGSYKLTPTGTEQVEDRWLAEKLTVQCPMTEGPDDPRDR